MLLAAIVIRIIYKILNISDIMTQFTENFIRILLQLVSVFFFFQIDNLIFELKFYIVDT